MLYSDTLGPHFTYEPLTCDRYLGDEFWCKEEFTSKFELKQHQDKCFWVCDKSGCPKAVGVMTWTKKREIDKHKRKHEADQKKIMKISLIT